VASDAGLNGYAALTVYCASKGGVVNLTRAMAMELAPDVRVNCVCPGYVDTDMVRQSRPDLDPSVLLHPDDIAQAVLYLLSLSERAAVDQLYIRRRASSPF
jgi:NAD(P)-dependent dehydrogenase (short-subunit alcohol dehydrogenase family)